MYFEILRDVSTRGINRNPGSRFRRTLKCVHRNAAALFVGTLGKLGSRHGTHCVVKNMVRRGRPTQWGLKYERLTFV
jgi:hypothetical protein